MIFNLRRPVFSRGAWTFTPASGAAEPEWDAQGTDWMMAIPCSGVLTIAIAIPHADLCLVAGGQSGVKGNWQTTDNCKGGSGGEVLNLSDVYLPAGDYSITLGASDQNTVLTAPDGRSWTARTGQGSPGGGRTGSTGSDGVAGTPAFGDTSTLLRPGWLYGPGGGHGVLNGYSGDHVDSGAGGDLGTAPADEDAGHGGVVGDLAGRPGCPGTGQGGGGGGMVYNWGRSGYDEGLGAAGGSGVFLMRNHKEVTA